MIVSQNLINLKNRDVSKNLSKKILLTNTGERNMNKKGDAVASPIDPIFFKNSNQSNFNPDIRYRYQFGASQISKIDSRNNLLLFSENTEVKKAIKIMRNEMVVTNLKSNKYPVFPTINITTISEEKQETAIAMQNYLDEIFYPDLYRMLGFKKNGLKEKVDEYLQTGKLAWEIVYDNLKNPKDITKIIPIDPSTLQKFVQDDEVWYVQQSFTDMGERVLHENQVILIEHNKYEFGYISYADQLRRPFNIMRSMFTSKQLWFAVKSQVRMHIKLAMGDIPRADALQKLSNLKSEFSNTFNFNDQSGQVMFNNEADTIGYHEYYTAETNGSGTPEIEEVGTQGPDLSEVDSLDFWEKFFWKSTGIPMDRIDANSSETWSFSDVTAVKKTEINFAKDIEDYREIFEEVFRKPILIQLTLKEAEIGLDLSLIDSILIEWAAFNNYEKLAELEVVNKQIEVATALSEFGKLEDADGNSRAAIPLTWIIHNYLSFTPEQLESMEVAREQESVMLGFKNKLKDVEEMPEETAEEENLNFDEV